MNIAIITNKPYHTCETFIKAQIDHLPFNCIHYYGTKIPFQLKSERKNSFAKKVMLKMGTTKSNPKDTFIADLKKQNIQLLFAHYGMMGTLVLDICKELNLPLIVHFHGHDATRKSILEQYGDAYKKMFLYPKTQIISVSHTMTERLIQIGCPKDKITYNTYGPNQSFIELKPQYLKPQFIFIGRFVDKKAPHLLLLAFKKVYEKHQESCLIMAGDGLLLDSCKTLAKALNIESAVAFVGRISPQQFKIYLSESLAYVQHSIEAIDGDMEGTPVSILEASAAGLPIISTTHAGIPDVIVHNTTGLLSTEFDTETMTKSMLWVLENKEEAIKMGLSGKKHIKENFSFQKHLDGLVNTIISTKK